MLNKTLLHKPAFMYPWAKRTLFVGSLPEPVTAAYGAATLVIALGRAIQVRAAGKTHSGLSFLIPPGVSVSISASHDPIAIFHLDVLGDDYTRFDGCFTQNCAGSAIHCELRDEADYRTLLGDLYHQPASSSVTYQRLDGLLEYSFEKAGATSVIDRHVINVIDHIKSHYQDNIPIEQLARRVNLSTPSLIRKFKQQSGIPIRRFRLWHRIYESMICISAGQNLTDAAMSVGFNDSSHYTHTLQAMWGVSPSTLFSREISAEIIPPTSA